MLTTGDGIVYQKNSYFGASIAVPSGDAKAIKSDPKLVSPGMGASGSAAGNAFASLGGYKLAGPAENAGATIANNGGADFWANTLYVGAPDVGAFEAP